MTREELTKMTPRERDALVAEKIFGLAVVWGEGEPGEREPFIGPWRYESWVDPPRKVADFVTSYSEDDPEADYEVLKHVREKWDNMRAISFQLKLHKILAEHGEASEKYFLVRWGPAWLYEPGDYSLAALATVMESA